MDKLKAIKLYFQGLEKGSFEDVVKLFSDDAIVLSPLYGQIPAKRFYKELFEDTTQSQIVLKNAFINPENPNNAAAHFHYTWTMSNGSVVEFDCVDVFEFASEKIQKLTIIYDTYKVRNSFEKMQEKTD